MSGSADLALVLRLHCLKDFWTRVMAAASKKKVPLGRGPRQSVVIMIELGCYFNISHEKKVGRRIHI